MPEDIVVRRGGDGKPGSYLEIYLSHDGDVYVFVRGVNRQGLISEAQIELCAPSGGGCHIRTIKALYALAKAIQQDNQDPNSPARYAV